MMHFLRTTTFRLAAAAFALFITGTHTTVYAQGCVAIRHMSSCSGGNSGSHLMGRDMQVSLSYRYFESFRHFSGKQEKTERQELGNQVINYSNSLDLGFTYGVNSRLSLGVVVPLSYTDRSSWYEHDRANRYYSTSKGLGDIRVQANYWVLNPETNRNQNISVGLGLKMPTGNNNAKDEFHIKQGDKIVLETRPVDQSIQLGDGGWAPTLELQAYKTLFRNATAYLGGFYMVNPRDTTDTRTYRETLNPSLANEKYTSVPDQFMARAGLTYNVLPAHGLSLGAGGRIEGVPIRDLIGKENGFRRPGYVVSVEPTLNYSRGRNMATLGVPTAVIRNRTKSVTDKAMGRKGDAAFADYLVYINYSFRL